MIYAPTTSEYNKYNMFCYLNWCIMRLATDRHTFRQTIWPLDTILSCNHQSNGRNVISRPIQSDPADSAGRHIPAPRKPWWCQLKLNSWWPDTQKPSEERAKLQKWRTLRHLCCSHRPNRSTFWTSHHNPPRHPEPHTTLGSVKLHFSVTARTPRGFLLISLLHIEAGVLGLAYWSRPFNH